MEDFNQKYLNIIKQLSLRDLQVFCVLYESRSYTKTAQQLNTYVHTCKRIVEKLEALSGYRLVQTTHNNLLLSSDADKIYSQAKAVLAQAKLVVSEFQQEDRLKLYLNVYSATLLTKSPIFSELSTQQHALEIGVCTQFMLQEYGLLVKQHINNYDVIVLQSEFERFIDPSLWLVKYRKKSHLKLYASPEYVKMHGLPQTPKDLAQHNCLLSKLIYKQNICFTHKVTEQKVNIALDGNLSFDSLIMKYVAIVAGMGIGMLLEDVVDQFRLKDLVVVLPEYDSYCMERSLYVKKGKIHPLLANILHILQDKF